MRHAGEVWVTAETKKTRQVQLDSAEGREEEQECLET